MNDSRDNLPSGGWLPIRVFWERGEPLVDWCDFGERPLAEPFFAQTVATTLQHPYPLLFRQQTPLASLTQLASIRPGLSPSGFIFHWSRCGSTLVAQMLAALPGHVVISEAETISTVLNGSWRHAGITDDQRIAWLQGLLHAYGQRRRGDEERFFVKFDSWDVLDLPLLRRAFPQTPWIFLYRDPVEVFVSHSRYTSGRMVPTPVETARLGLDLASAAGMAPEEYWAHALTAFGEAALSALPDPLGRVIAYRQLPEAVETVVASHFGLTPSSAEREIMRGVAAFDAKLPTQKFADDSALKQSEADETLRRLATAGLGATYSRLERACQEGCQLPRSR